MRRTVDTIERDLGEDGLLRRWTGAEDGAFIATCFWLADCRARAGDVNRARELFEHTCSYLSDVGLLSEEIDLDARELIGNHPQALSHVGLVNAARSIQVAEESQQSHG